MAIDNDIRQWFESDHLQDVETRNMVEIFKNVVTYIDEHIDDSAEKSVALRKLLEGKDAAVRGVLAHKRQSKVFD